MKIPLTDVTFSKLSVVDIGRVFWWEGRLFRAILNDHVHEIKALFDSGLIDELESNQFFVKSQITSMEIEGYGMVIEHEVIDIPTYPKEWTFSMLKDAAQLVLDINEIAIRFGYQTKDCHGYNVLFENSRPIFVDLGSFTKVSSDKNTLYAYAEFMRSYYYPLKIWQKGGQYWGIKAATRVGSLINGSAYLKFSSPTLRILNNALLERLLSYLFLIRTFSHLDLTKVRRKIPKAITLLIRVLAALDKSATIPKLKKEINNLRLTNESSTWANYQNKDKFPKQVIEIPRFDLIVQKIHSLDIESVVELAGNQGVFANLLIKHGKVKKIICTDADSNALDKGYRVAHEYSTKINWAILNPFDYEENHNEIKLEKRFSSDAVVALALTHHLILTQGFSLDFIFNSFKRLTRKYIFVEFMPLGLHNGQTAPPLPTWYTIDWFKNEFSQHFNLIEIIKLEENRVLFIGDLVKPQN
jgi:hypothetical protein